MLFSFMMKKFSFLLLSFLPIICFSQALYNFESGNLSGWTQVPDLCWAASTSSPLGGSYSLKHTFNSSTDATDRISTTLPSWNPLGGFVTWQVKVRHGYDPSSSNRWWIMLMSDNDASHMQPTGMYSGYAVGVNLTGGDDLLKLWRVDNGIPQEIITSTLNWQTQIGKTNAGAIEVERMANGAFTLKASVTGSFSNLTSYGSAIDNNHSDFNYFGICYSYSSSGDQLLWVDDILLNYSPLNKNDLTSEVFNPAVQINAGVISSSANSSTLAVDVLKFQIKDNSILDSEPTKVKKMLFKKVSSSNPAGWVNTIGGVRLRDSNGELSILSQLVSEDGIMIEVDSTASLIPNGQAKEYTLSLFLKQNNLVDGSTLKIMIDSIHHGFEGGISGSDFANIFSHKIVSNEFKVDVEATNIKFQQAPSNVNKNTPFTLSVMGADDSGNLDKDFTNSIVVALSQGTGILSAPSGLIKTPLDGVATWSDLNYSSIGRFKVSANSSGFQQIISNEISVLNDTTSTVNQPVNQPIGVAISSLSCFPAKAVEMLRFSIYDQGNTDGVPTIVKNIKISRMEMADAASLLKSIEGILVVVDGKPVNISQPDIKTNYFTFSVENLVVPDGEYKDVSIYIYLKDQGLTDNQKIQLKVDAINHGFTTDIQGSTFKSIFPQQVVSNIFWIDVVATQLKFSTIPTRVGVQQPFSITINATDSNGNMDKDFSGIANLSLFTGNGLLAIPSGSTSSIVFGSCIYNALTYSVPDHFSMLVSSVSLKSNSSSLITCGDSDGGIIPLSTPQNPVSIKSTTTNAENSIEVIRFNVFDGGSTDGLPLIPSKISLHCFDPSKAEHLNEQIGGFVVNANGKQIDIESYSLNDGIFEIFSKPENLIIPNGDTVSLSISIFLAKSRADDNFPFQFYIPAANHGWETSISGTDFSKTFNSTIYGSPCKISVEAASLKITKVPFIVSPLQPFLLKVLAIDAFGSVDNDYNDQLTLFLDYGTGEFSCPSISQDLISGSGEWSDIKLDKIGTYRFKVSGKRLGDSFSDEIYCGLDYNCLVNENFENTLNQSWQGVDQWTVSTVSPINGSKSLQHKQTINSGASILSIPVNFPSVGERPIEWNFTLRNGNWNPSTDNYFYYALMADSSVLVSDSISGFFVGINPSLGSNSLILWRSDRGVRTLLLNTSFLWGADDEVSVKVELTPKGEWKLWYSTKDNPYPILGGVCKSFTHLTMGWSGLTFNYTSSRAGQLWFDDLSICSSDYPPVIISAKAFNSNTVSVQFSKEINPADASKKANYTIEDENRNGINIISATKSIDKPQEVILKTDKLPFGKLKLKVNGVKDLNGSSVGDSIYFGLGQQGTFGRLVINEVMANPIPSRGLPQYEYIELYNPSIDTISLKGWKLYLNSYSLNLPADLILPKQYAILCSTSAVVPLSVYGKAIGVTSFPALLNSGMTLKLIDSGGSLISLVNYSDSWYDDDQKKEGGWSLEKIDFRNLMEGKNNWRASISSQGGTPCFINSVATTNPDITSPRLLSFEVVSDSKILLQFLEPMDSLTITYANSYNIDNEIGNPSNATLVGDGYSKVMLELQESISPDNLYNLCFSENLTDFSGNHFVGDCIPFTLPQTPAWNDIVINEMLFNPNVGGVDFVEIYNRSNKTFDLSKISLSNRNNTTNKLDQVYSVTDTAKILFPQSYAVITTNPSLVKMFYHTENDKAFVTASSMAAFNNDEGYVVLLNKELEVIDEFHYFEGLHSKLLNDFKGVSLERINPELESSSASTWHSTAQTIGFATPTYKNSQWVEPSKKDDEFVVTPEIFSPDGDGKDDYLLISFKLPNEGSVANIRIFDSEGREIKRLTSNLLIGTEGTITWDGLNNSSQKVPIGIYIVYIECFNPNGEVKKFKKTCVVAEKL